MGEWATLFDHEDYTISIKGLSILVRRGVFTPDPKITYSAKMILDSLGGVSGKQVLDMGTGSGVLGLYCASQGATVELVDINQNALLNARVNAQKLNLINAVNIYSSNLFTNITKRFDLILANLPILETEWNLGKPVLQIIEEFLEESKKYLLPNGRVYLSWASFADIEPITRLVKTMSKEYSLLERKELGYTWYIFIILMN